MATKCLKLIGDRQCGQLFDESGYCVNGHEDPSDLTDDLNALRGEVNSCSTPLCGFCKEPIENHTEAQLEVCLERACDRTRIN